MDLSVATIKKSELSELMLEEAIKEGWLYSEEDVDFYFNYPRNKIFAIKVNKELAGCVILHESAGNVSGKTISSGGLFLVIQKYRGQKIVGPHLLQEAMISKISNNIVCFHAVPRAVEFYNRLGFHKTPLVDLYYSLNLENAQLKSMDQLKDLFHQGIIQKIDKNNFTMLYTYNSELFAKTSGLGFQDFIKHWIERSDATIFGYFENNSLKGYGISTLCKRSDISTRQKLSYRISPLYAANSKIAISLLKALVCNVLDSNGTRIDLNSLASPKTEFGKVIKELGFTELGKNYVVCNHPKLITKKAQILNHIFCSIPLEYPHEVVASF